MSHNPKVFCTNRCLMLLIISCYYFLRWALFLNIPEKWHNFGGVKFNNFNHPILEYLDVSWLPKTIQFNIWFWRSNTLLYWLQEQQQKHVWRKLSVKVAGNKEKLYSFNYHFLFLQYFAQWSYQNNIEINQYIKNTFKRYNKNHKCDILMIIQNLNTSIIFFPFFSKIFNSTSTTYFFLVNFLL